MLFFTDILYIFFWLNVMCAADSMIMSHTGRYDGNTARVLHISEHVGCSQI